uniref:F-box domain-containing protein n=1 Tax=Arundo donax TaxID=35708 RepID=A0A0A8XVK1_ARUDO
MPMKSNKRMKTDEPSMGPALPDEIVTEVLLWLPVKSLLRFRAVCRSWAATLSSDEFCALHMARFKDAHAASARPKLLLVAPTAAYDSTALYCSPSGSGPGANLLFTLDDVRGDFVDSIAAQCRGLTLLYDAVAPAYYVVNAATRAVTRLPPCQDVMYSSAGLGFDAHAKEYKVMRLFKKPNDPDVSCEVYTLGGIHGYHWRPAAGRVPSSLSAAAEFAILTAATNNLPPLVANGSLHWLIDHRLTSTDPAAVAIITFSIAEETFGWVLSPPFSTLGVHLVEIDCCLCAVRDLRHGSPDCSSSLEIWKLQDYTTGVWLLDTRIDLSQHTSINLLEPRVVRVLGAIGDGRSVWKIVMATSDHNVITYDVMSRTVETIISISDTGVSYRRERTAIRVCLFKESLAPVYKTHEEISFSSPLAKVIKEILLRLPARFIVQFKLVCNQWRGFIEDKSFTRSHFAHKSMEKKIRIMLVGKGTGRPHKGTRRSFFHFAPLEKWLSWAGNEDTWLDTKVVCSKPCHGLNLLSTPKMDYLYNPCTGYSKINSYPGSLACAPWETPSDVWRIADHAFAIGNKNVGLGFNPIKQEHVAVIILYQLKDFESRDYRLTCSVWHCRPGFFQEGFVPPLPVNEMPPAYVAGVLYWMSDPALGPSSEYAIVSFDIARDVFDVISCPAHIAKWSSQSARHLFVVELVEKLCVVVADLMANELVVWKLECGEWGRAYTVCLKASPDYSLVSNVVVPLAVDPKDGRILLSTGTKIGFYDPVNKTIEELYAADEILRTKIVTGDSSQGQSISRCARLDLKSLAPCKSSAMPLVPMLYEESLCSYPRVRQERFQR